EGGARGRLRAPFLEVCQMDHADALNYYINFLLYAIVGRMAEADDVLRQYKREIYEAARVSTQNIVPNFVLYRGILLHPNEVQHGRIRGMEELTFVSFSQSLDVARWFADTGSIISGFVKQQKPWVR